MSSSRNIVTPAFFVLSLFACANGFAGETAKVWAAFTTPTNSQVAQSIGNYTNGCIGGAMALPLFGKGYQVMRVSRNRYFGHPSLVQFIERLGQTSADQQFGTLLIGDLGQPRGGPTPSGHRSHQTGLDVDIWFMLSKHADNQMLTENERETWAAASMLDAHSGGVDYRQWTLAHAKILQIAASQPEVERIFVNPHIKRELCRNDVGHSRLWLRKIRPWWKHDDHFHVRLKCPDDNPYCAAQEPLPGGDGCDASLDWWFTPDAAAPKPAKPAPPPKLPALCEQVMQQ